MKSASRERGAALLVTLVLVALIALLAFGTGESARLQQRLASNELADQIAFQGAEAALKAAEQLLSDTADLDLVCNGGEATYVIDTQQALDDDAHYTQLETNGREVDFLLYASDTQATVARPRYMIGCIAPELIENYWDTEPMVKGQAIESVQPRYFFRVLSLGFGPGGRAERRLEARYVF